MAQNNLLKELKSFSRTKWDKTCNDQMQIWAVNNFVTQ
jgi:hypothetical protein